MLDWISTNIVEIIGTLSGFIFLYFEIKQSKWLWPVGLFSALMYIYVFFMAKFYADMGLQVYYVFISLYGWYMWSSKKSVSSDEDLVVVRKTTKKEWGAIISSSFLLYFIIWYILSHYTDSPVPKVDAFTTAFSIMATWMMTRKLLEQWIFWIVIDFVSMSVYLYKDMYPTSVLMGVYTILAYVGFMQWKKQMELKQEVQHV